LAERKPSVISLAFHIPITGRRTVIFVFKFWINMSEFISYSLFTLAGFFFGRLAVLMRPRRDMEPGTWKADFELLGKSYLTISEMEKQYVEALSRLTAEEEDAIIARMREGLKKVGYTAPQLSTGDVRRLMQRHLEQSV
jgi:hypothetical protein